MADLPNFYDPTVQLPKYNVASANQLLDEARLTNGSDGVRFKLGLAFISTLDADRQLTLAQAEQASLESALQNGVLSQEGV